MRSEASVRATSSATTAGSSTQAAASSASTQPRAAQSRASAAASSRTERTPPRTVAPATPPRLVAPAAPSQSEVLATELKEAESRLAVLEDKLGGMRRATASKRNRLREASVSRGHELKTAEEQLAARHGESMLVAESSSAEGMKLLNEEATLRDRLRRAEARNAAVEDAVSSELYWQWKGVFEAHLRAGGNFENFSLDAFFRDFYSAAPTAELEAVLREVERLTKSNASMEETFKSIDGEEKRLRGDMAGLMVEIDSLRRDARDQDKTNHACWQGQLQEAPRRAGLRLEQNQLGVELAELEMELQAHHERAAQTAQATREKRAEAAHLRAHLQPCEQLVTMLEQTMEYTEAKGERIKQTIEMKEYELGKHQYVRSWKREMRQLDSVGPELQQEALMHLQEAAVERAARDSFEEEMRDLDECIRAGREEALLLNHDYQKTAQLLMNTTEDLSGLELAHEELCAQHDRAAYLLEVTEENVQEATPSPRPTLPPRPMERSRALAMAAAHLRSRGPASNVSADVPAGAGAMANVARAALAGEVPWSSVSQAVPRPLPVATQGQSLQPAPRQGESMMPSGIPSSMRDEMLAGTPGRMSQSMEGSMHAGMPSNVASAQRFAI